MRHVIQNGYISTAQTTGTDEIHLLDIKAATLFEITREDGSTVWLRDTFTMAELAAWRAEVRQRREQANTAGVA